MDAYENNNSGKFEQSVIKKKINKISRWVSTNYGLDCYNDNFFGNFLHRCNFDEEICKEKFKNYFRNKFLHPEYFQAGDINGKEFRFFCSSVYSLYMPKLSSNGCRIFVDKVTNDENLFDIFKIMKYYCMQTDILYLEEGVDNGDIILFDCNNMKLLNLIAFTPYFIKSLVLLLQMYPLRIKLLVLINTGSIMEICIKFLKWTLLRKFDNLVYAYSGGHKFFLEHCDRDVLPTDYCGDQPSLDEIRDDWLKKLDKHHDWFFEIKQKVENSHDIEWSQDKIFGLNGSFQNLKID